MRGESISQGIYKIKINRIGIDIEQTDQAFCEIAYYSPEVFDFINPENLADCIELITLEK